MKIYKYLLCFYLYVNTVVAQTTLLLDSTYVDVETIVDSNVCNGPWDVQWGPDNRLWYTDIRTIKVWDPSTKNIKTMLSKSSGNFMGLAIHPNFPTVPEVFATWDTSKYYGYGNVIKLLKYTYSITGDSLSNETQLIEFWHGGEHSGGRVIVTSDLKLMLTAAEYFCAMDTTPSFLRGKVLRINRDGSVPTDNPVASNYMFTYGHRNCQGIAEANNKFYVSEFGQINDELNVLKPNRYYGWGRFDGNTPFQMGDTLPNCLMVNYEKPIDVAQNPPAGIEYYSSDSIPEFKNSLLESILSFGGVKGGVIAYRFNSTGDSVIHKKHYFIGSGMLRIRDVTCDNIGNVYVISNDRESQSITAIYNSKARIRKISKSNPTSLNNTRAPRPDIKVFYSNDEELIFTNPSQAINTVQLIDLQGRVLVSKQIDDNAYYGTLNVLGISKGVYIIQFIDNHGRNIYAHKIFK